MKQLAASGQWTVTSEKWPVASGQWTVTSNRRPVVSGQVRNAGLAVFFALFTVHCPLSTVSAASVCYMRVTAYCPCTACCGPHACGLTATGRPAAGQIVAVDPRRIPLGSMVHVNGRWHLAADTGRAIQGARVDLLCATHDEARQFGTRWLPVTILSPAEWQARLDDAAFDARFVELVAAGRRLATTECTKCMEGERR